jgi:hypothetical protein
VISPDDEDVGCPRKSEAVGGCWETRYDEKQEKRKPTYVLKALLLSASKSGN